MEYKPKPVVRPIESLPGEISELMEILAQNVHDQWAEGRIRDGWKYGKERNDQVKEHPSLIPYGSLSEEEKEYDRRTVIATLSCLIENGYEIIKKELSMLAD